MKNLVLYHVIRMTKLFTYAFLIQALSMSFLSARNGNAQIKDIDEVMISIDLKDAKIERAFSTIEKMTGFIFVYTDKELKDIPKVSTEGESQSVYDLLSVIGRQTGLYFKQVNQNIHVRKSVQVAGQENDLSKREGVADVVISGKVTDSNGEALPGATVTVAGTSFGTVTDLDGNFSLTVPEGATLAISFIGYKTQRIEIGNQTSLNVQLEQDASSLDEVVVVGYGLESRKNLTSAISTIGSEELNRGAISDVGQLLQGKVPGLNISRSGDPNRNAAIILRGASTLRQGAQEPLFVIDGVIGADISLIAPDDIVSIDVLKDAAGTAIYGNRAANGVIMVTTRRAKKGEMQMSYSGYTGIDRVSNRIEMMDAAQLRQYLADNGQNLAPQDDLGANTNWQEEVQRASAMIQNHNISMSGGTDKTLYSASLNYFDQQGIVKGSSLNRVIARLSVEQKAFSDKLTLGMSVSNSLNDAQLVPYRNTVLAQMLTYLPTVPVRTEDGAFYDNLERTGYFNPVSMIENAEERSKYNNFLGTLTARLELPFGINYDMNFSFQNQQSNFGAYYNSHYTEFYNNVRSTPDPPANPTFITLIGENGQATRNSYQNTNTIFENYFTWNRDFGNHNVNAVFGYSWQENILGNGFQATSTNFPVDDVKYNNLGMGNPYAVPSFRVDFGPDLYQQVRLISNFARVNYNYSDKYLLQLSLRRDGSSAFGENERWGYFPSVGAAWRISQEDFMSESSFFDDLKLRASYGVTGNSFGFSPYTTRLIYGTRGLFYYQGTQTNAIGVLQNENPDLRWEKTATGNIGLDFTFLRNRVNGSIEAYNKRTTDLIWNYQVSTNLYPAPQLTANVGEMTNRGIELMLDMAVVQKANFSYNTTLNFAHNRNLLNSLSNANFPADSILMVQPDGGGQTGETVMVLMQGQPMGQFFTYEYAGKNADGVSQFYDHNGELTTTPQLRRDYRTVGNAQPDLLIGWNNNLRYKNFDMNIFFRSVIGNEIMNVTMADLHRPNTARLANIPVSVANESVDDINSYRYSSRFVENGTYLRLDNATLGYSFRNLGKDFKMIRVYTTVNNLFVLTNYSGIDPEINQGGLSPGVDARNFYPKTRTFMVGVNATF